MSEEIEPFKVGESVQVKSGGPIMKVRTIEGDYAICVYITRRPKGWNQTEYVKLSALTRV